MVNYLRKHSTYISILPFSDSGGFGSALQGRRYRDSDSSELPIRSIRRGAQPAPSGRSNNRRPLLRGGSSTGPLRDLPERPVRQVVRLVLHRLVRGQLVRGEFRQGGYQLHEGANASGGRGPPHHRGSHVEPEQRHHHQWNDLGGLPTEAQSDAEEGRLRHRQ